MWLLPVCFTAMANRMDLTLLLLLVMLLRTVPGQGELRARDPDVEEQELGGWTQEMTGTSGTPHFPTPHGHGHGSHGTTVNLLDRSESPEAPLMESPHQPARTGNWCAFVHRRMVTTAVLCGTEPYTVATVNNCPDGDPDCQVTKQVSSRPVYRQKQRIFTALKWKCCPGHRGPNCQETENTEESQNNQEHPERSHTEDFSGGDIDTDLLEDTDMENRPAQQSPSDTLHHVPRHTGSGGVIRPSISLPFLDSATLLTAHQIFAAMMTQIQPVLEGFNRTLEHLSSEVAELSMDLQKLRDGKESLVHNSRQGHAGRVEEKLEDSFVQIRQIQEQLGSQQKHIQKDMQLEKELVQYNLSALKKEIDLHINQKHDDVQMQLQSLSESVEEIRHGQKRLGERLEEEQTLPVHLGGVPPAPESSVWEAISSLEKKVLNNTIQLSTLSRKSRHLTNAAHNLDTSLQNLSQRLELVSQKTDSHFAETGLEVEAARVAVQESVNELGANLSTHGVKLREIELDLDNIYQHLQRSPTTSAEETCSCKEISESLVRLEAEVANVTDFAKENRYALEDAEAKREQDHLVPELEDLHMSLMSVKDSLAFEQTQSRTLTNTVSQLKALLLGSQQEILGLKERVSAKETDIKHLFAMFTSLLNDAIRHSDVLEVLLGNEVIEFTSWSNSQQKEMAIPVLLEKMRLMQEKIDSHEKSLTSRKRSGPEKDRMTSDDPVAFSEWSLKMEQGTNSQDHQDSLPSTGDDDGDYSVSDFWSLGKEVEELADRLSRVEEQHFNCTASPSAFVIELQEDVASLRQALGDHLRTFQNLFSYTDEFASSSRSVNLDQLWTMISRKNRRKKEKIDTGSLRSKRNTDTVLLGSSNSPVAFITTLHEQRTSKRDQLFFKEVALNDGNAYSPSSGAFLAPQTGLYLLLVTLDFEKGPSLAQLRHGSGAVASFRQGHGERGPHSRAFLLELQRGDRVTLELVKGRLRQRQPNDNTFAGVLLFNTEDRI